MFLHAQHKRSFPSHLLNWMGRPFLQGSPPEIPQWNWCSLQSSNSVCAYPLQDSLLRTVAADGCRILGMQSYPGHPAVCSSVKCTSLCGKYCLGFSSCLSSGIECFSHVYSLLSLGKACNRISALLIVLREKAHCCVVPWENCTLSSPAGCNRFPIHY